MMSSTETTGRCRTTRVFAVLDLISRSRGARLTKIAERSGLPITTTHRLLAELVELGVIERLDEGYQIGSVLFDMALRAPVRADLLSAVRPALHDLYSQTGETVYVASLSGRVVSVMDAICAPRTTISQVRAGDQLPAHATAAGKCLLATCDHAASGIRLDRVAPRTVTNYEIFARQLHAASQSGFARDIEEWRVGLASVAAPIYSDGSPVAAVVVTSPIHKFRPEQCVGIVQRAAKQATQQVAAGRAVSSIDDCGPDEPWSVNPARRLASVRQLVANAG